MPMGLAPLVLCDCWSLHAGWTATSTAGRFRRLEDSGEDHPAGKYVPNARSRKRAGHLAGDHNCRIKSSGRAGSLYDEEWATRAIQERHRPPRISESRFRVHLRTRAGLLAVRRTRQSANPVAMVSTFQLKMMSPAAAWPSSSNAITTEAALYTFTTLDRRQLHGVHDAFALDTLQNLFNNQQLPRGNQEGSLRTFGSFLFANRSHQNEIQDVKLSST